MNESTTTYPVLQVSVTRQDIDEAVQNHCLKCPVAKALARATGQQWHVSNTLCFSVGSTEIYELPLKAVEFIKAFDENKLVKPFDFELVLKALRGFSFDDVQWPNATKNDR